MKIALTRCKIYDIVVLLGIFSLTFCTVGGFICEFWLAMRSIGIPDTLSRASAASLGALIVIVTNAARKPNHDTGGGTPGTSSDQS